MTMLEIRISVDQRSLAGRLFEPAASQDGVIGDAGHAGLLFVHGYASDQIGYQSRAEAACRELGLMCFTFDLGGHGNSTGNRLELSRQDHLQDLIAAYDWLRAVRGVDPARIGVCGASYGAYLACMLISERPVKRLLLRAPALPGEESNDAPEERQQVNEPANTALRNLRNFRGDTLVLESEADEVISHAVIDKYLAAASRCTHHVIPDAAHALVREEWNAAFIREILEWFRDL
jgi:pimeloyl-ACP methyl ester carboxylesterase